MPKCDIRDYDLKNLAKDIHSKEIKKIPTIDINDINQVAERMELYINSCVYWGIIPTLTGLAYALGVDRRTLYNWQSGRRRNIKYKVLVDRYKTILESILTQMILDNKINASVGIFLLKNNFAYSSNPERIENK